MQFHRRLHPIAAISFDLDDTLYDNKPVLLRAEQRLLDHLQTLGTQPQLVDSRWWRQLKQEVVTQQPQLLHDSTAARLTTLNKGLAQLGITDSQTTAQTAMSHFLKWRSEIEVSSDVIQLLQDLAQRYPLAVITNGNADVTQFLPQIPFKAVLGAGKDGLMKPEPEMFQRCCQRLNIEPQQLLHVGDHPISDVAGAIDSGCQAVWLTPQYGGKFRPAGTTLATATISSLEQLRQLL